MHEDCCLKLLSYVLPLVLGKARKTFIIDVEMGTFAFYCREIIFSRQGI